MNTPDHITDIVWDADNTLWDWVTYAVHAYEAMAQCIAQETGIPEPKVAAAMKKFYTDVGTMENPFLIQGLQTMGFFKGVKNLNPDDLIEKAQSIFSKVRYDNLKLYEEIDKILKMTHESGINNHILTDAPGFQAAMRIRHFGLQDYIKSVSTMPSPEPKTLPKKFRERMARGKYRVPFTVRTVDKEKPHTDLEKILRMTREQISHRVLIIGDNAPKDGRLALNYHCAGIIAAYGIANPDLLKRILRFAPAKSAKKNMATQESTEINLPNVHSPGELKDKLDDLLKN